MSRQGLEAFVTAAQGDPALADGAARAAAGHGEADCLHAVASFARGRGYDVGDDELAAAWREASMARTEGELSDGELDGVAGGFVDTKPIRDGIIKALDTFASWFK